MEILKEFKYYDPSTKEPVANPAAELSFRKNNKAAWSNHGKFSSDPKYWVAPETKGEEASLKNFDQSRVLSASQAGQLDRAAMNKAKAEQKAADDKAKAEQKTADDKAKAERRAQIDAEKSAEKLKNDARAAAKSATTQEQKDAAKAITAAETAAHEAEVKLQSDPNNPQLIAGVKAAKDALTQAYINMKNLVPDIFHAEEISDKRKQELNEIITKVEASDTIYNAAAAKVSLDPPLDKKDDFPAIRKAIQKALDTAIESKAFTTRFKADEGSSFSDAKAQPLPGAEEILKDVLGNIFLENKIENADEKKYITDELSKNVNSLISEINKDLNDGSNAVKYHCDTIAPPVNKANQVTTPDKENSTEPGEKQEDFIAEESQLSRDLSLLKFLEDDDSDTPLSADTPAVESGEQEVSAGSDDAPAEAASDEVKEETGENSAEEKDQKIKENPEGVTLPSAKALGKVIALLNKQGHEFKTKKAKHELEYRLENVNADDASFDIIVTRKSTEVGEGWMKDLRDKANKFMGKLGDIAGVGDRGNVKF